MKRLRLFFSSVFFLLLVSNVRSQELKWLYKIGGTTSDYGAGVTIDSDENIYDITSFMGTAFVANNLSFSSKGAEDILIRKSSSLGFLQWVKHLGGPMTNLASDVSVDIQDNVYVGGTFQDSLMLGNTAILSSTTKKQNSFLVKLNGDGNLIWAIKFESDAGVYLKTVTSGLAEELLVSGTFEGNTKFSPGLPQYDITSNGGSDIFILKLNGNTGLPTFLKRIGGGDHEFAAQHTRDNQNNIYITGDFRQVLDFDPNAGQTILTSQGLTDIFLLKLNANGVFQWAKSYGGIGVDYGHSVAVDGAKNPILSGRFSNEVSFGLTTNQKVASKGQTDAFIAKFDQNGNITWVNSLGDTQNDQANQIAINTNGIIYVSGIYRGIVDFNWSFDRLNESESKGGADAFVLVLNQDGTYNEHFTFGGLANEQINDIGLKQNGDLISTGGFGAIVDFDPSSDELNIISTGGLDAFLMNTFICVNPYLKEIMAPKPEVCKGDRGVVTIVEGYLNGATQWSWQKDSCTNITFASGTFIDQVIRKNTSYFLKGSGGCVVNDECKRFDIKVFTDSLRYQNLDLCQGDTIKVGNSKYTTSGVFTDSLISKSGCDSVIVTEINIFPIYSRINRYSICTGDTIKVGNSAYTFAGNYTDKLASIHGCDSIIISIIEVLPSKIDNIDLVLCKGKSQTVGNATYNSPGTYIQSSIGVNGCEDLLIVKVSVLETDFEQRVRLCEGEQLKVGTSIYSLPGTYKDSLHSVSGCDSIVVTFLTFAKKSTSFRDYTLCEGDSIRVGTKIYKKTGNFIDTLSNLNGCDSIVYSDIRVLKVPAVVQKKYNICEGGNVKIGNKVYTSTGIYRDTLDAKNGCDSVLISEIKVSQKLYFVQTQICNGDSISFGDTTFTDSGLYTVPFKNIFGCDSILVVDLKVVRDVAQTNEYAICPGDSVLVGNVIYKKPGIYVDRFTSSIGCDSIVTSKIRWNHIITDTKLSICQGDSVKINGLFYKNTISFSDTLTKQDGCDSILNVSLKVYPRYEIDTIFNLCAGGSIKVGNSIYANEGKFAEALNSVNGCDSTVFFEIKIINFSPIFFQIKDTLQAFIIPNGTFQWNDCVNGISTPISGATQSKYRVTKSGKYSLSISLKGCTYTSSCVDVIVSGTNDNPLDETVIYPNPFSYILSIKTNGQGRAKIKDMKGSLLHEFYLSEGTNDIDMQHLVSGMYLLEINTNDKIRNYKIVKTN